MWRQGLRFVLVGLVNTGIGFSVILGLHYLLHWSPMLANAGGYGVGGVVSYLLSRGFTFRSNRAHRDALPRFVVAVAACFALNLVTLQAVGQWLSWPGWAAQALAVLSYNLGFFVLSRQWVFAPKSAAVA
jgi:putative flippase GtrA